MMVRYGDVLVSDTSSTVHKEQHISDVSTNAVLTLLYVDSGSRLSLGHTRYPTSSPVLEPTDGGHRDVQVGSVYCLPWDMPLHLLCMNKTIAPALCSV